MKVLCPYWLVSLSKGTCVDQVKVKERTVKPTFENNSAFFLHKSLYQLNESPVKFKWQHVQQTSSVLFCCCVWLGCIETLLTHSRLTNRCPWWCQQWMLGDCETSVTSVNNSLEVRHHQYLNVLRLVSVDNDFYYFSTILSCTKHNT